MALPPCSTACRTRSLGIVLKSVFAPALAVLLVFTLAFALVGCGGGGNGASAEPPASAEPDRAQALAASKPGALAAWAQDKLRARQTQGSLGMTPGLDWLAAGVTAIPGTTTPSPPPGAAAGAARSSTLVQEAGVDEADLLLSDGTRLFTLQPKAPTALTVKVHSRNAQGVAEPQAEVAIVDAGARSLSSDGMYLSTDASALTVLTQAWYWVDAKPAAAAPSASSASSSTAPLPPQVTNIAVCNPADCDTLAPGVPYPGGYARSRVGLQRVTVTGNTAPAAGERISIEGALIDSRRIGDTLYLVTQYSPQLPFFILPTSASAAEREDAIKRTTAADLLPTLRRNGGPAEALLSDTDCYVQAANASTAITVTTITMIDLKSPTLARSSRCFAGGSEALYMSTSALYLATTRWSYPEGATNVWRYPAEIMTDVHKFALQSGGVAYKGSGAVNGHLGWDPQRKSMRLSEHNGDLRVLTYTGDIGWFTIQDANDSSKQPSPARLTVLRERASDQTLQVLSTLPNSTRPANIGKPFEQVYGVRFVGDRGYVVTFRRTDPLYVLDLSNPADPKTAGELEVAGFSEHLIPLANNLLLGVGRGADNSGRVDGLKVALFDVADATRPRQVGEAKMGGPASQMTLDLSRHGLNYLMKGNVARVAMPVNLVKGDYTSSTNGLQRFEVDTQARTLRSLSMLGGVSSNLYQNVWLDRSLQIEDQVYYLNKGLVSTFSW
jgi:hypothetical protein